jgi:Mg-chelatase subunit ChlD
LVLGGDDADGTGYELDRDDARVDAALGKVYDAPTTRVRGGGARRAGGLARSAPAVARWLGDIRRYFPTPVVQVLQRDALTRFHLTQLLLEPELLRHVEPDVHLVSVLLELNRLLPDESRATARQVVQSVVEQLERRFGEPTRAAVHGALARAVRTSRPRPADIDWSRTIAANLRHWIPSRRTVIPERLVGAPRRSPALARDVVVAVDQSGSMSDSIVHASLFACVLARMPALRTSLVAFDTAVVDLTEHLHDPVDVLFGVQLGGGTDIAAALGYCQGLVERPRQTLLLVVSDLFEGGDPDLLRSRVDMLVRAGVTVVVLLAVSDEGAPVANHHEAAELAARGAVVTTCTPAEFPDLIGELL